MRSLELELGLELSRYAWMPWASTASRKRWEARTLRSSITSSSSLEAPDQKHSNKRGKTSARVWRPTLSCAISCKSKIDIMVIFWSISMAISCILTLDSSSHMLQEKVWSSRRHLSSSQLRWSRSLVGTGPRHLWSSVNTWNRDSWLFNSTPPRSSSSLKWCSLAKTTWNASKVENKRSEIWNTGSSQRARDSRTQNAKDISTTWWKKATRTGGQDAMTISNIAFKESCEIAILTKRVN